MDVTNNHCANCNALMFVEAGSVPDLMIYKVGTLDDKSVLDSAPPVAELYTRSRPDCFEALKGANQVEAATK